MPTLANRMEAKPVVWHGHPPPPGAVTAVSGAAMLVTAPAYRLKATIQ